MFIYFFFNQVLTWSDVAEDLVNIRQVFGHSPAHTDDVIVDPIKQAAQHLVPLPVWGLVISYIITYDVT